MFLNYRYRAIIFKGDTPAAFIWRITLRFYSEGTLYLTDRASEGIFNNRKEDILMAKLNILSQDQIKAGNRANIIHILRTKETTTKQEIAKTLGLSIPTVTTNINELLEEGLIVEAGVAQSTGGRKPMVLQFQKNAKYTVGVDITPNKVNIVLVNLQVEVIGELSFRYARTLPFEALIDEIELRLIQLMADHEVTKNKVVGIGFSLPGLVDEDQLIFQNGPNMNVRDYGFTDFEQRLGIPVVIENEANIGAFAEASIGIGADKSNMVYISITEGVGTGIIIDNHIFKSSHKKAGEFGHMRISDKPIQCNCGRTGCWELFASKKALLNHYYDQSGFEEKTLKEFFEKVTSGEVAAIDTLEWYIKYLYIGIENIILGLNPDHVIIGGELGRYGDIMRPFMKDKDHLKSTHIDYEGTEVLFSALEDKGPLMGAALLALESLFNGPFSRVI